MKLLMAFIEASGFDVEEIHDTKPDQKMIDAGWSAVPDSYKVTKKEPINADLDLSFNISTSLHPIGSGLISDGSK